MSSLLLQGSLQSLDWTGGLRDEVSLFADSVHQSSMIIGGLAPVYKSSAE